MDKNRFFEGCGKEGPIRCICFCEFHPTAGPKISCQVPADFISKDTFEAVSVYLITKAQLLRSTLTITTCGIKILGFPVRIDNKKYPRNAFYFNMCFVCDSWARTVQYESVVKKLSDFLTALEVENSFLSQREENPINAMRLTEMMAQALHDLNSTGTCTLTEGCSSTHLKVTKIRSDPPPVFDHQVPVIVENLDTYQAEQWDLTTQQVLPHIDGINHVAKISALADVENNLVKTCLQNLVYYGVICMVPIFQYSNCYAVTSKIRKLAVDRKMQDDCLRAVSRSSWQLPHFRDVFKLYCSMNHGTTVKDLCLRFNLQLLKIDERKLIQFGLVEELIRRIHKYKLIENLGLEKEIYNVATEDGYILRLTRLVIPEKMNKTDKGIPMLMVNGLFLQSDGFLLHDKPIDNPAIYWLTHGYDIWLGDQRGTMRSREHKSYNANTDAKYWDFSFHEIGVYDLPAFIDFIIRKTDHKKVCYCGLSLSTTFAFVMLAEKPEYNDKIHIAIQFVPVADMPVLSTRTLATQLHFNLMSNIMYYYLMVNSPAFLMDMEKFRYHFHGLCSHIPHLFAWTMEQGAGGGLAMDINYLCKQMGMMYSTASVHTFLHTMQLFKYGEFRKYDVGKEENKQKYGEEIPPFYNYSKIVAPIAFYFSDLDEYSPAYVVKRTVKKLGGPTYSCLIEQSHHVEALVGVQFGMHYNKDLIEVLDSATGRSSPDKLKSGTCNR